MSLILSFLFFAFCCIYGDDSICFAVDEHTVALWRFNEGSGDSVYDISGNGNHGKIFNNPLWVAGKYGGGLKLDGINNYIEIEHNASQGNFVQITIEAYIYYSDSHEFLGPIVDKFGPESELDDCYHFTLKNDNSIIAQIGDGTNNQNTITSSSILSYNEWHLIQTVYYGDSLSLFIDDSCDKTILAKNITIQNYNMPIWIGRSHWNKNAYFDGIIDEIRISNIARTPRAQNNNPTFSTIPSLSSTTTPKGFPFSIDLDATDSDGHTIQFSLPIKPSSMSINASSGLISWTPSDTGQYQVRAVADDGNNGYDTLDFTITVYENYAPEIITKLSAADTMTLKDMPYNLNIEASDANDDSIIYSLSVKPPSMSINPSSGLISWAPADTGTFTIKVLAQDTYNVKDSLVFTVTVISNNPPVFSSSPDTIIQANRPYKYVINVSDPDSDNVICSLITYPEGMQLSKDTLKWVPKINQVDRHSIKIKATDSNNNTAFQTFSLLVIKMDESLVFAYLLPMHDTTITENDTLIFTANAHSLYSPAYLNYSWKINGKDKSNSVLCTLYTDSSSAGICTVQVTVSDSFESIDNIWYIEISNKPVPPTIILPEDGDSVTGYSTFYWKIADPDMDTASLQFKVEFILRTNPDSIIATMDSIHKCSFKLNELVGDDILPDSTFITWRIMAYDSLNNYTDFTSSENSFFYLHNAINIETGSNELPKEYELFQNCPNPFNPSTTIRYSIPSNVKTGQKSNNENPALWIYNIHGKLIRKINLKPITPGYYSIIWDAVDMRGKFCPNGLYVYKLQIHDFTKSKKMLLLK